MQQQIATLSVIRDTSPNTPIGNIQQELFVPTAGVSGGAGPYGGPITAAGLPTNSSPSPFPTGLISSQYGTGSDISAATLVKISVQPYKEGSTGSGVTAIQDRLSSLGCYGLAGTGAFDATTAAAVEAFMAANENARTSVTEFSLLSFSADAPSSWINDPTPGTVDHTVWQLLFSPSAKSCR
jgi:hypothetical protein